MRLKREHTYLNVEWMFWFGLYEKCILKITKPKDQGTI